jgi:hypothetical protein
MGYSHNRVAPDRVKIDRFKAMGHSRLGSGRGLTVSLPKVTISEELPFFKKALKSAILTKK